MGFFVNAHGSGGDFWPPSLITVKHILQWWNLTVTPDLKKIQNYINHVTHPLSSADISIFSRETSKFCCIKKCRYRLDFDAQLLFFLTFLESLIIALINVVTILMMSPKMATPGCLKIAVFWNKGFDAIIFVHDVTNKFLSRDLSYIIVVVLWPNFCNCSISMREVIITSIL